MTGHKCHGCSGLLPLYSYRCVSCGVRNRLYTRTQWIAAVALGIFVLLFFGKR